jgi:hypothetical protein
MIAVKRGVALFRAAYTDPPTPRHLRRVICAAHFASDVRRPATLWFPNSRNDEVVVVVVEREEEDGEEHRDGEAWSHSSELQHRIQ